jgi:hypothetical protein
MKCAGQTTGKQILESTGSHLREQVRSAQACALLNEHLAAGVLLPVAACETIHKSQKGQRTMQPPLPSPEEQHRREVDAFDTVRHCYDVIQRQTYLSIKDFVGDSSEGLSHEEALDALDGIRDAISLRDYCQNIFSHFAIGGIDAQLAVRRMQEKLRQLYGSWEDYVGIPDREESAGNDLDD